MKIKRIYQASCPVKTVAIIASNDEFSYIPDEMPELIKELQTGCKTREEVLAKVTSGALPKIVKSFKSIKKVALPMPVADMILFDTVSQIYKP